MQTFKIGIVQGRLSPKVGKYYQCYPGKDQSLKEFDTAKDLGLSHIELIADQHYENPLCVTPFPTYLGQLPDLLELNLLSRDNNIDIKSICADVFMDYHLHHEDPEEREKNKEALKTLLNYAGILGVKYITLPFVDNSSIKDSKSLERLKKVLLEVLPIAQKIGINLCLEMDFPPKKLYKFIKSFRNRNLKINYDSGNSASLGYNVKEEFDLYANKIGVIHIKDRVKDGGSVQIGTGDVNWLEFISMIKKYNFKGPITMQAARCKSNEIDNVAKQLWHFNHMMEIYS